MRLAPICLFVYNRPENTELTINSLAKNFLAIESDLYIFSDGPKNNQDYLKVSLVRKLIKSTKGFNSVTIFENEYNFGLAKSIIEGVSRIIQDNDKVIVLEDDLETSNNFLDFMNQGLYYYRNNNKIHSISGFTMQTRVIQKLNSDFYYNIRASSWGWATWSHTWNNIDWQVTDYKFFRKSFRKRISFNKGGSDMSSMLDKRILGEIDSWAIIFCFDQWKKSKFTVFPVISKVVNRGFSKEASNTKYEISEYISSLDKSEKREFNFEHHVILNKKVVNSVAYRYSYIVRLKNKIQRIFNRILYK